MNNPFLLHRHHAVIAVLVAAMLGLTATSGCAKAPRSSSLARDISPTRETRGAEALQSFEEFRTQAQFQAACARWQDGDPKTCEQMLQAVLTRTSDHYQARLTLADLYAATDRPELAEQELQNLLERDPHDPQAHHSLGLLLESTGRNHEALTHFQMAVKFDPKNELYSASEETMLTATRPSSPNTFAPDKPAGPAMASLRDVSPRLASTPRSQIKMVAHHESQKSPKLPSPISPTKRTTAIINDVE